MGERVIEKRPASGSKKGRVLVEIQQQTLCSPKKHLPLFMWSEKSVSQFVSNYTQADIDNISYYRVSWYASQRNYALRDYSQ